MLTYKRVLALAFLPVMLFPAACQAAVLVVASSAAILHARRGFEERFDADSLAIMAAGKADVSPNRARAHFQYQEAFDYGRSCVLGAPGVAPSVVVWSDSFGVEIADRLAARMVTKGKSLRQLSASACSPGLDGDSPNGSKCTAFNQDVRAGLREDQTIRTVIVVSNYLAYRPDRDTFSRQLTLAIQDLRSSGKRIVIVYPIPVPRFDVPTGVALLHQRGRPATELSIDAKDFFAKSRSIRVLLDGIVKKTGAEALDPSRFLCTSASCTVADSHGRAYYFDDRHLSMQGANMISDALIQMSAR